MSLIQRIANQTELENQLLLKNSQIGQASRISITELPTPMSQVDEELIKDYQSQFPTGFQGPDGRFRKYIPVGDAPELDEPELTELLTEEQLAQLEDNRVRNATVYRVKEENMRKIEEQYRTLVKQLDDGQINRETFETGKARLEQQYRAQDYDMKRIENNLLAIDDKKNENNIAKVENQKIMNNVAENNRDKIRKYKEELNLVNRGAFQTEQMPNETEEQYLTRLRQNAEIAAPEEEVQLSKFDVMKRFREKMRELITKESLIEQVANSIDKSYDSVENRLYLLKVWEKVKKAFLDTYGFNNKNINAQDIITFFQRFITKAIENNEDAIVMNQIKNENSESEGEEEEQEPNQSLMEFVASTVGLPSMFSPAKVSKAKSPEKTPAQTPNDVAGIFSQLSGQASQQQATKPMPEITKMTPLNAKAARVSNELELEPLPTSKKVSLQVVDNTLIMTNVQAPDNPLYLKTALTINDNQKHLLYSFTGTQHSYSEYKSGVSPEGYRFKSVFEEFEQKTGINRTDFLNLFKASSPSNLVNSLINYGVKPETQESGLTLTNVRTTGGRETGLIGWGVNHEKMPTFVPFGKMTLNVKKLYYDNMLILKWKNKLSINGFPNVKVSDKFVAILMDMVKGIHPTQSTIHTLTNAERMLYDKLIMVSKLSKDVIHSSDKSTYDIKRRLKVLEGEWEAGNNNPDIPKEIKHILLALKSFGSITHKQMKDYIKQYKM